MGPAKASYGDLAGSLRLSQECTMPVNPYDDRKVSLSRRYGNGDLDIVRASYIRRKANVTEALAPFICK